MASIRRILLVVLVLFGWSSCTAEPEAAPRHKVKGKGKAKVEYLLNLPHCKVPAVPLLNPSILPEWTPPFKPVPCPQEPKLATLSPTTGVLTLTRLARHHFMHCCVTFIERPELLESDRYLLSKCYKFGGHKSFQLGVEDEYFFVKCVNRSSWVQQTQFMHNFALKPSIQRKMDFWRARIQGLDPSPPPPVSVMLLLIDSVSRAQAQRGLPKAVNLMEKMGFIDFRAQHVMGEPTIENEVPIMLGTVTSDWEKKPPFYVGKYDSLPFIWRNFSDSNYVTMDNEDASQWHTFNFNGRTGFTRKPFDYFLRPYYLAQDALNGPMTKKPMVLKTQAKSTVRTKDFTYSPLVCMENKPVYDFLFGVGLEFLRVVSPAVLPSFSLNFLSWPQHDYLNSIQILDDPLVGVLKSLRDTPAIYENTVLVLGGDHGMRWANYSDTEEGLLERDLAWLSIRLPDRFVEKYPGLSQNMAENAKGRVTSHVDLFKTLAHLHQLGQKKDAGETPSTDHRFTGGYGYNRQYGRSLLDKIDENRTCDDAKVPRLFCACNFPLYDPKYSYEKYRKQQAVEGLSAIKN